MIDALTNHLWQSTLFAVIAGVLTLALRKNRAHVRFWLWFSASLKFLVPFSLLINLGSYFERTSIADTVASTSITFAIEQMTEPFSTASSTSVVAANTPPNSVLTVISAMWLIGVVIVARIRFRDWQEIRRVVYASTPVEVPDIAITGSIEVRSACELLEPAVVGWRSPVLLLPPTSKNA